MAGFQKLLAASSNVIVFAAGLVLAAVVMATTPTVNAARTGGVEGGVYDPDMSDTTSEPSPIQTDTIGSNTGAHNQNTNENRNESNSDQITPPVSNNTGTSADSISNPTQDTPKPKTNNTSTRLNISGMLSPTRLYLPADLNNSRFDDNFLLPVRQEEASSLPELNLFIGPNSFIPGDGMTSNQRPQASNLNTGGLVLIFLISIIITLFAVKNYKNQVRVFLRNSCNIVITKLKSIYSYASFAVAWVIGSFRVWAKDRLSKEPAWRILDELSANDAKTYKLGQVALYWLIIFTQMKRDVFLALSRRYNPYRHHNIIKYDARRTAYVHRVKNEFVTSRFIPDFYKREILYLKRKIVFKKIVET